MLLSDRDIRAEVESGRVALTPYEPAMVQPSSVDVRLDRYFRVFENHRYPHIDPAEDQSDLGSVRPDRSRRPRAGYVTEVVRDRSLGSPVFW